jgi:hypothetical protein
VDLEANPGSWLQIPTLNLGAAVDVVGEMAHQDALATLAQDRGAFGTRVRMVTARLIAEPHNPHDERAIRVDVGGAPVGHIARHETDRFHPILKTLAQAGQPATCRAKLVGGWDYGNGDTGFIGLRLLTGSRPARWNGRVAFLPESPWHEHLAIALLPGPASAVPERGKVLVALVGGGDGALAIRLGDAWIGHVVNRPDLTRWVAGIQAAGLPCTANLRIHNRVPVISVADQDTIGAALHRQGAFDPRSARMPRRSARWLCRRCHLVWFMHPAGRPEHGLCRDCGSHFVSAF